MADGQEHDGGLEKGHKCACDLQRLLSSYFIYASLTDAFGWTH